MKSFLYVEPLFPPPPYTSLMTTAPRLVNEPPSIAAANAAAAHATRLRLRIISPAPVGQNSHRLQSTRNGWKTSRFGRKFPPQPACNLRHPGEVFIRKAAAKSDFRKSRAR